MKYANDYRNAKTEAEKSGSGRQVLRNTSNQALWWTSFNWGLSGAGITGVAVGGGKVLGGGNIQVDPSLQSGGEEGGGTPPSTGAGKVTAELSVNFSDVRDEAAELEVSVRTDPTNDDLARRLNIVQEQLDDYQQAVKQRPVYIADDTQENPLRRLRPLSIPTASLYAFSADTQKNSVQSPFINTETYATQKEAIEAGKRQSREWVKTQLPNATAEEVAKLKEIQSNLKSRPR